MDNKELSRDWLNLTWSEKTWWERVQTIISFMIALAICVAGTVGVMLVLGNMIDASNHRSMEYTRCLKNATNGYEIKQCR